MKVIGISILIAGLLGISNSQQISDCLKQDSISCVQKSVYNTFKDFFNQDNLEIVSGVSLVRNARAKEEEEAIAEGGRSSNTGTELGYDQEINNANDVDERQTALEGFVTDGVSTFLTERSLRINFAPAVEKIRNTARALTESVSPEIRSKIDEIVEGRGKKKILKALVPLVFAIKAKMVLLGVILYFGAALLAKKAILASLVSLAISGFQALKLFWASKSSGWDTTSYNSGWSGGIGSSGGGGGGGWSSSSGWEDSHPYSHGQSYSNYYGHH